MGCEACDSIKYLIIGIHYLCKKNSSYYTFCLIIMLCKIILTFNSYKIWYVRFLHLYAV